MFTHHLRVIVILTTIVFLPGCAAVAVTGVAAGATVAADSRTTGTVIEDQSIELKAIRALSSDEDLKETANINTTSYNTIVLLTGEAPTEELKRRAAELVRNIEKVTQVHNEITVAAPSSMMSRSSDTLITSRVKTRLLANRDVSGLNTKVVTDKGTVYLMGLSSRSQADKATDIARTTSGVQKVVKLFQYTD